MTPEGRVRTYLRKRAKAAGFEHRKLRWIGRAGAPDELLFWPEGPPLIECLVEVKRFGEAPEPHQAREIARLVRAGWRVEVVDSEAACDALIERLTQLCKLDEVRLTKRER